MTRITEQSSEYRHLEKMSIKELLENINKEDHKVAAAVKNSLPEIEKLTEAIFTKLSANGRLFYIGAGTSGRLGILDASECPPTFGIPHDIVIGIIAGGDGAIRKAVEFAEDDIHQAWKDLEFYNINSNDFVIGLAASGTTPYVIGALHNCMVHNIQTGAISCNPNSEISKYADFPVEVIVGPEFLSGSTRMKSGTAQKLVLNMISTSIMIKLGHVKDNKMVDMQLSNEKLVERGIQMILQHADVTYDEAKKLLLSSGSVRNAMTILQQSNT
jgi:N-acetylmuramic acid 6-phosphate etherase